MQYNAGWDGFVSSIGLVGVIRKPHNNPILSGFVVLQWAEARLINRLKNVINSPLLRSEDRKI